MTGSTRSFSVLRPVDALIIIFALLLLVVNIVLSSHIPAWYWIACINIFAIVAVVLLARIAAVSKSSFIRIFYDWYPAPLIFFSFKEIYVMIQSLGRPDFDQVLITIDHWLFGVNPTVWLQQFAMPWITEVLQIAYASFYILMITTGLEPYLRKEHDKFSFIMFTFLYGFFLSYVGYLFVPGIGPRFTLHNFTTLNNDLPGLFCTDALRDFINAGESIPRGVVNAAALAQRDVFPSGHTEMTLLVMYLAAKFRLKSRYVLYVFGTLLIIATVYLRYHYVIDVIAGAAFMVFTVWCAPKLVRWWESFRRS